MRVATTPPKMDPYRIRNEDPHNPCISPRVPPAPHFGNSERLCTLNQHSNFQHRNLGKGLEHVPNSCAVGFLEVPGSNMWAYVPLNRVLVLSTDIIQ